MAAFRRNNIDLPSDDPRVMHAKDPIAYQHPHPSPFSPQTRPPPPHTCPTTYTATVTVPSTSPTKFIHPSRTITAPTSSHANKQDDEDELEVIGSGIGGPYRLDKHAIPPALPNLKYDHPETTVQNYSPGTSLVFNAYKGHASLLAQPYHASTDDDSGYRDYRVIQNPSERELHPSSDYAYARRPDFYSDYHDEIERRGRYNPSPGRMDREPRDPKGPDNRAPPPEYYQHPRSPHSHPQSNSQSHSHPRPPPPMPYHERDHPTEGTQHNCNSSLYNSRSDPYYPHHEGPWTSEHRPYSAAIDIPQPNRRFPPNSNRSTSQANYRDIDKNSQQNGRHPYQPYDRPSHPMPPGSRVPTGPRYALSQVNYRMIYEYAREVHDCLIKGKIGSTDRLLYNAEILSKVFMGCRVDQDPAEIAEEETFPNHLNLLGPRTLCNACGLIWGKMSRSKAALAKAAKQVEESKDEAPPEMPEASGSQSSSVLDDTNMSDISPTHLNTDKDPMEVSRKRARDPTPVEPEIDELEDDSSMDGDINIKEDVAIPVEGLHISSNTQSSSGPFPSSSAVEASVSPKTPSHATTSTSMHQRQHQHMLPLEVPSNAMVLGELGKAPVTGKKLALSYLLD
ncbi:hypothetical protein BGZ82_007295 [Podila clonocystis]|nr:hypothetical protein BGZ82_007295 [Podila clonocystis]